MSEPSPHRRPTQATLILALLRDRGDAGLTPLQALEEVGCFRLASRIHELVHEHGHDIETKTVELGNGKRVARYVLHEAPQRALGL